MYKIEGNSGYGRKIGFGGEYPVEFGGCTGIFTNLAKFFTILTVLSNIFGYETDNNSCVLCVSRFGGSECAELEAV